MRKVLYLLGQLSDSDIEWMIEHGEKQRIPAGTILIHEGREIDAMYILLDGGLDVTAAQLAGKPIHLCSGEVVGEVSFLDSRPPGATVSATVDSVVLAIPRETLAVKLTEDSKFAARFYQALATFLAQRLRTTGRRLGFGKNEPMDEETEYDDELSPELLDRVHVAASRFDRVLQRLLSN